MYFLILHTWCIQEIDCTTSKLTTGGAVVWTRNEMPNLGDADYILLLYSDTNVFRLIRSFEMKSQTSRRRWETNHCVMYADSLKSIIYNWKMVPSQIKLKIRDRNINRPCTGRTRLTRVSGCKSRTFRVRNLSGSTRSAPNCVIIKYYIIIKEHSIIDLKQQRKICRIHINLFE